MTLSAGLRNALSSLSVASDQVALVSRNIARAGDADATRKYAEVESLPGGGVRTAAVLRVADPDLMAQLLSATAEKGRSDAIRSELDKLGTGFLDPDSDQSAPVAIGRLADALQLASANPADPVQLARAVSQASDLARVLNAGSTTIYDLAGRADRAIGEAVAHVNGLLARLEQINGEIVVSGRSLIDSVELLDTRDSIVKEISGEIGVRASAQTDNGIVLQTDSGIVLFDKTARPLTFSPSTPSLGVEPGNAVLVDGVAALGGPQIMEVESGRLKGLI